jgi:hypothetical protein
MLRLSGAVTTSPLNACTFMRSKTIKKSDQSLVLVAAFALLKSNAMVISQALQRH